MATVAQRTAWTESAPKEIARIKRHLVREIKKRVEPLYWESGFPTGKRNSRTGMLEKGTERGIRLYAFKRGEGYRVRGHVLEYIFGFSEVGIVTDLYVAMATMPYEALPVEDLLLALKYADRAVEEAQKKAG